MSAWLKEGAGGKVFPFGRWNREAEHHLEVINAGEAAWYECTCGEQGPLRSSLQRNAEADADAEAHERAVFERQRKQGRRFVRGAWE